MNPRFLSSFLFLLFPVALFAEEPAPPEKAAPPATGDVAEGKLHLTIDGQLNGKAGEKEKLLFATSIEHSISATRTLLTHRFGLTLEILQGDPKELALTLAGEGEIREVTGADLQDWSVRKEADGSRTLLLRPKKTEQPLARLAVVVVAERPLKEWKNPLPGLVLTPPQPALSSGFVVVESTPEIDLRPEAPTGLFPIEPKFLPEGLRQEAKPETPDPLAFQFHGAAYSLALKIGAADPETRHVVLHDLKLVGQFAEQKTSFTLTGIARVTNPQGGRMTLLSGALALTELPAHPDWQLIAEGGRWVLVFEKAGEFPLQFKFDATVGQSDGWKGVDFQVGPSALQPIVLQGLPPETQFDFPGAARPERAGDDFTSFLPPSGEVKLSWKTAAPEAEGKLFYAAEMRAQITVGPGLLRQAALLEGKVMQGELDHLVILLRGSGEVTRVEGSQVLTWKVEPGAEAAERRLLVQFNQPQKSAFSFQVQTQAPLAAFPQTAEPMSLRAEGATRFAGYLRIVNEGAVRLEVAEARGLAQISPDQFPEDEATNEAFPAAGEQKFAYRFSGADFALRIQADQILPELTVSQVLAYHLGETELSVEAEIEVEIREAPLRELLLRVPKGYAVARLISNGMADYFLSDLEEAGQAELRLVYTQPLTGRQVVQLRLEHNQGVEAEWALPRVEVMKAKSTRGHVAVSADAGFRLNAERTQALTEIATAFFPRKLAGIQAAFRLSDPAWQATMHVERLPQSIQVDAFHLFSIGEGVAYGSSVLNYAISGSPVTAFKVELSDEYFNVEFTGKDLRNWQKTEGGYVVQLHTPVTGAYTLLTTYERPFKPQGETLAFTGAHPLDAQTEQGHTLVISAYQFQVKPVEVSPGLLPLETAEVPGEYRLFFDAPILAAYRYTARPFSLKLALSPLAQGDSLSQVVDRAALTTHISKEGQVLTDAQYFVKNRGHGSFRVTLPPGTELWSATVNGADVSPVKDGEANLVPLPQQADPDAVLAIALKLASRSAEARRLQITTPAVGAPILLGEWKLEPDTAQRLTYRGGSLLPAGNVPDRSGFAELGRTFWGGERSDALGALLAVLGWLTLAISTWLGTARSGTYKWSARYTLGLLIGSAAFVAALLSLVQLSQLTKENSVSVPNDLSFIAPVQQAGQPLTLEIGNVPADAVGFAWIGEAWPAALALLVWATAWVSGRKSLALLGWVLLAWATLRWPGGGDDFFLLLALFLAWQVGWPALRRLWSARRRGQAAASAAAPVAVALLLLGCAILPRSASAQAPLPKEEPVAETVTQTIRVEEKFALATAKIHWQAVKGQRLPLLSQQVVLTHLDFPAATLKLIQVEVGVESTPQLLALESGAFDIEFQYQAPVSQRGDESGFQMPVQPGLVNRVTLSVINLDVDIDSQQAVSVVRQTVGKDSVGTLVLIPLARPWLGWKPRSRDVAREKAVFYAELTQLYAPAAGSIEGLHRAAIRPAQGELGELLFDVPKGATITDVTDAGADDSTEPKPAPLVSQWRFDPDTGKLRVTLSPAQSTQFTLLIRSQIAAGPMPATQTAGLITVENAAGQIGLAGIATGDEVQLDSVSADTLSPINLEDFPADLAPILEDQITGLTVRRAFRYADGTASFSWKASPVEPDVRIESQSTLSLGEDRALLAVEATVAITRAGIFRLSFVMPEGMDVEAISGESMSHWTEAKSDAGRIITLHLRERTEGEQKFTLSLTGPGLKSAKAWPAPQLNFREAGKQRGTYLVVPEQGMRLQAGERDGITQLDPQKSGITQKGVLAFRVLQSPWKLTLDIEQVDPWVQVTSLQHATVGEAQIQVVANLQYQIENTGLKTFHVSLPANAEKVRFQGEQVADFRPLPDPAQKDAQTWEVKMQRRIIGQYLLQATYSIPIPANATETSLRGVQAAEVNLQRGFVTVQSGGRLQVRVDAAPPALQPAEWQSIPRALQQDLATSSASFAYRLVEPAFTLPMQLERHEATKLLPARVNQITLTSVLSDSGAMLTRVHLEITPGDKRLLHFTLPKDGKFWFAFVNGNGVWPWREQEQILLPLEQQSHGNQPIPVEFFYSSQDGTPGRKVLEEHLPAPKFDLPLENITWKVYLNERWRLAKWTGSLQLQDEQVVACADFDSTTYLQKEAALQRDQTQEAEQMLNRGNSALAGGDPWEARRAFASAFGLSQHDNAFNEDARVQWHNVKLQQALVGLNVRQAGVAGGEPAPVAGKLHAAPGAAANYTQDEAKQMIDRNSADDNAAFNRLAERILQQQDAAVSNPSVIQATLPEEGLRLTFSRAVAVDQWADLQIDLKATATNPASWAVRLGILAVTAVLLFLLAWLGWAFSKPQPSAVF